MKEVLVSSLEAAHLLGVSVTKFQQMVKTGVLTPHPGKSTKRNRYFRMTDIAAVQEIWAKGSNPEAAFVEARQAGMEARVLRRELERLRTVLGLNMPLIPTDRDSIICLVLKMEDALRDLPTQDPVALLEWARTLHSISEGHIEAIAFHTEQKEPWKIFLNLGKHLMSGHEPSVTKYDAELYHIYVLLAAAIKTVRQAAYFYVRLNYGKKRAAQVTPEVKGCPHEDVIAMSLNGVKPISSY